MSFQKVAIVSVKDRRHKFIFWVYGKAEIVSLMEQTDLN